MPITILVVDDNEQNSEPLLAILEIEGHSVSLARDGFEAIEAARWLKPAIILADVMMPKMSGITLHEKLQAEPGGKGPLVILMTASNIDVPASAIVLRRPFPIEQLIVLINQVAQQQAIDSATSD